MERGVFGLKMWINSRKCPMISTKDIKNILTI